jgi:hypothetical protein
MSKASFDDSADYNNCPICQNDVCEPEIDTEMTELMQSNGSTKTAYIKGKEPFVRCKRKRVHWIFFIFNPLSSRLACKGNDTMRGRQRQPMCHQKKMGCNGFFLYLILFPHGFFFLFLHFPDTCCGMPIHVPCVAQFEADNVNQCVTKGKCPNCAKKYKKRGTAAEAKFVVKWANQGAEWAKQWLEKEATDGNEHAQKEKENVTDA